MIKLYNRLVKNCQSKNMYNRVHIKLENYMTPEQFYQFKSDFSVNDNITKKNEKGLPKKLIHLIFTKLYKRPVNWKKKSIDLKNKTRISSKTELNQHTTKWIKQIDNYFKQVKKGYPEPFIKKRINRFTLFFTSKNQSIKTQDKTLLVCFTGHAQRMMMPLPVFLQSLNSKTTDIVYIRNLDKPISCINGMSGYDQSFEEMLIRLGSLPFNNYKKVVGMGTSGGTLPILLLSLKYSFNAVMTVGTSNPKYIDIYGENIPYILKDFKNKTHKPTSIYLVYGANNLNDKDNVNEWKELLEEVNIIEIDDAEHIALKPLIKSGKFTNFLSNTVFLDNLED